MKQKYGSVEIIIVEEKQSCRSCLSLPIDLFYNPAKYHQTISVAELCS